MSSQQQDLVFFTDGLLLTPKNASLNPKLHIISHHDGTSPMWLTTTLAENCLVGTANLVNRELKQSENDCSVVYASFLHTEDVFEKASRRQAVDLGSLSLFKYLDYSSSLFTSNFPATKDPKRQLSLLFDEIAKTVEAAKTTDKVVFLDSPELLLAATNLSSADILAGVRKLQKLATVITVINVHTSMFNMDIQNAQDPAFQITDFYVKLCHMSSLNISLQPLATGKAKDITGSLTVTRGAIPMTSGSEVLEREYVFQVTKDATAKLYFR